MGFTDSIRDFGIQPIEWERAAKNANPDDRLGRPRACAGLGTAKDFDATAGTLLRARQCGHRPGRGVLARSSDGYLGARPTCLRKEN